MFKKLITLTFPLLLITPCILLSQSRSAFSGDPEKFKTELTAFMGTNLNPEQLINLNSFLTRWDSAAFSKENMMRIIDISSQLSSRLMRPVPHLIITLQLLIILSDISIVRNISTTGLWDWGRLPLVRGLLMT